LDFGPECGERIVDETRIDELLSRIPDFIAAAVGDTQPARLNRLREIDVPRLYRDLLEPNPVGAVVTLHLRVESLLDELILLAVPYELDLARWSIEQRLALAVALGLVHPGEAQVIRRTAALRNKVAHRLHYDLTREDVNDILAALPPHVRFVMRNGTVLMPHPRDLPADVEIKLLFLNLILMLVIRIGFYPEDRAQGTTFRKQLEEAVLPDEEEWRDAVREAVRRVQDDVRRLVEAGDG
jgi:hypothetical protein